MNAQPDDDNGLLLQYGYKIVATINPRNPFMSTVYLLDDDDDEPHGMGILATKISLNLTADVLGSTLVIEIPLANDNVEVKIDGR